MIDLKFEIPQIAGEGLTGPPPQTPFPLFLGFCSRFGLRPI